MRAKRGLLLLGMLALLLLEPTKGFTQFPGGRPPGGGPPGGGPPGGGYSGGYSGKSSRGSSPTDYTERWRGYTGGKDVWVRSEIRDPALLERFDRYASRVGNTTGQLTLNDYMQYIQMGGSRGGPPSGFGGAPSGTLTPAMPGGQPPSGFSGSSRPPGGGFNPEMMAEFEFRRRDTNGDGLLNFDEMPDDLKAERDKWDTNRDGFIDLNEFKAYIKARMDKMIADRGGGPNQPGFPSDGQNWLPIPQMPMEEEEKKPVVYRAGNLPKELPAWFKEADTDGDGQVGLYEWKAKGWKIDEFEKRDRNNDGFLTIEEVLRYEAQNKTMLAQAGTEAGAPAASMGGGFPGMGGGPGGAFPGAGGPGSMAERIAKMKSMRGPGDPGSSSRFGGKGGGDASDPNGFSGKRTKGSSSSGDPGSSSGKSGRTKGSSKTPTP